MRGRIASSVVIAAAILVGTAGCNMLAPQTTTKQYTASDGINTNVGSLDVRNAVIISDDGERGNLVFTVINNSDQKAALRVQYESNGSKDAMTVAVDAHETKQVGTADATRTLTLEGMSSQPGSLFSVYFQTGQKPGSQVLVPVLDGGLPEYADLVPAG